MKYDMKKKVSRYSARKLLCAGWAARTLTATVMLMMAVVAPVNVSHSYAAATNDESLAAVVELADYSDEREAKRRERREQANVLAAQLLLKAREAEDGITAAMQQLEFHAGMLLDKARDHRWQPLYGNGVERGDADQAGIQPADLVQFLVQILIGADHFTEIRQE